MEEIIILIKPHAALPKPGKIMPVVTALSEEHKQFKVKSILSLRWNKDGNLICELKGTFVKE